MTGARDLEGWELNVLGVYDIVSPHPTTGLEAWFEFLRSSSDVPGDIGEFGVFRGRSLLGAALLLEGLGDPRHVVGFDTFGGFPATSPEDDPSQFERMAEDGRIDAEHLDRVRRNAAHLAVVGRSLDPRASSTSGAFTDTSREAIERKAEHLGVRERITLYEGEFRDSLAHPENAARRWSGVLLDADLFDGYAAVLPAVHDRMSPGGMIYLDEYYSLKFPGPRLAVDAFCAERGIRPTLLRRDGAFERWAILT